MLFLKETNEFRKLYWIGLFVLLTLITLKSYYTPFPSDWLYTHLLFNYQDEFVKRGLVGEIIRQLGVAMSYDSALYIAYGIFLSVCAALLITIIIPFKGYWQSTGCVLFFLFVLSHSGTVQHFYDNFGALDGVCLVLSLCALLVIYKIKKPWAYFLAYPFMAAALLVHEGTFFTYIPLIFAFSLYLNSSKKNILQLLLFGIALLLMTTAIFYYGTAKHSTLDQHYKKLINIYGDDSNEVTIAKGAIAVLHDRGIKENMRLVALDIKKYGSEIKKEHLILFITLFPTFLIYADLISEDIKKNGYTKKLLLFASALSPLALYPLGYDFYRWWSLSLTNLFLVTAIIAGIDDRFRDLLISFFHRYQYLVLVAIIFCLIKGELGVSMGGNLFFKDLELYN
ncbi:hypothetical protein [Candidatus Nitrosacidococcus sp. I8]|uniref:hypothetical protein n=1 Tax=Candidatus Nitrosacidococcus sp. I8 TaxID=2942908 RepID=UPI002225C840|nr:hypothetical protein [Candidatus Nitrosacidococcus sp. I8]